MLQGKHIVVGISGGIAAYKIPELIRRLVKAGAEVKVTCSCHALEFVTETTLRTVSGNAVYSDVFAAVNAHSTEHISLPEWADMMLVAPATANVLGKMASGIADDALTTTFAATVARKTVVVAPAMNDKMYSNAATQNAIQHLAGMDGVRVIDCAEGFLACGTTGKGRMQDIEVLVEAVEAALSEQTLKGRHILVTAGPTREAIDPVRYVSNYSSGKMGYALAHECARRGAEVVLVSGPCHEPCINVPYFGRVFGSIRRIAVESAHAMYEAATAAWQECDTAILSAAVADFTPAEVASEKRKKQPGQTEMQLNMVLTEDIAAALGQSKQPYQRLIGFALETEHERENALKKLTGKHMDAIVLNSLRDAGAGFGVDTNKVCMIFADGQEKDLPLMTKQEVAQCIVATI